MALGVNRTDANVPPHTTYRNGTPITLPHNFGNDVDWQTPDPAHFGNPIPSDGKNENTVDWQTPDPAHFGNDVQRAGGQQATPTFSPVAGTYVGTQSVTITSAGADTIYYTTDGSTPTTGSTVYSGPVSVATSETVKALAVKAGLTNSDIGTAAYVITAPPAIALLANGGSGTGATPTVTLDTTGASLLVAVIGTAVTLGTPPISDNKGNTWQLLTIYGPNSSTNATVQIAYVYNPTVGTGHIFTGHGVNGTTIEVAAFSNTKTDASVFINGSDSGTTANATSAQTGAVTPSAAGDLIVSGFQSHDDAGGASGPAIVDSSLAITDSPVGGFGVGALAYLVSSDGSTVNPTWTSTTPAEIFSTTVAIAIFKSVNDPS